MDSRGTNNSTVKVGILGGIGPESTAEFYTKLITRLQESGVIVSNKDFPQIVINSIPAPELIYDKISDSDLAPYLDGLRQLDGFGVDFIVMVCNTIHLFYDKLQSQVKTPILDLRVEIKKVLETKKVSSVLVLGTPSTIENGLYNFSGIKSVKPNKAEIMELSDAIFSFNNGTDKELQGKKVKEICNKYTKSGKAKTVILGCTEFGLMLNDGDFDKINTIDVLVNATIDKLKELRRRLTFLSK